MQLKKLEIQGFKSFADKTEIVFLDGITTIVGPNGSGKSNISDAIRWVIGEQNVRNLRGAKMEDVIFSGTEARKKVGFAQVSMYLDNSDGALPIEYNEVIVTRRVYRSGESNYSINGNECRLKDIQAIFMDTGLGRDGYSIISQGRIDEILSSKSEERRHIFEEAAGIVKYKTRKEEASRKLQNTEVTLQRVSDVLNEIENNIAPLEEKATVAKKYLNLRDELKLLDVKIFVNSINNNALDIKKIDDELQTLERDVEIQENLSSENDIRKQEIKEKIQDLTKKLDELKDTYFESEKEKEKLNSKLQVLDEQTKSTVSNIERLEGEIVQDNEKIDMLKAEIQKRIQKRESVFENKKRFEGELETKQKELDEILATLDEKGIRIEELKSQIDESNDKKFELKNNNSSLYATIEANEKQVEDKTKQNEKSISQKDNLNFELNDISEKINEKTKQLNDINESVSGYETSIKEIDGNITELENKKSQISQSHIAIRAKYNYLVNLENENEGYNKSVKSILEYAKTNSKVYGTVASLISTREEYEYAIEIALGGFIQNVVVEDEIIAKNLITYLKDNSIGRVTFLPLSNITAPKTSDIKVSKYEGVIGYATELVNYDSKFEKAISLALCNIVIVDNIDNAIALSKKVKNAVKIVTLSGEIIAQTGSMTGGKTNARQAGVIGRKEKIAQIKLQVDQKEKELNEVINSIEVLNEKKNQIKQSLAEVLPKKETIVIEIATFNEKKDNFLKEISKIETQKQNFVSTIEEIKKQILDMKNLIDKNNKEILDYDMSNSKLQEEIDEYARFNREKQKEIDILNEDVVNLKVSLSSFDETVLSIDEMKEKIESDISNFKQGIAFKTEEIENAKSQKITIEQEILDTKKLIEDSSKSKNGYLEESSKLKAEKENYDTKLDDIDNVIVNTLNSLNSIKEEKARVEAKKIKFEMELTNLKNKMWDEYELTVSSSLNLIDENEKIDINKVTRNANKIRKEIKDLGEVNVSAIEEYQKTKERYDFIINQKNDLQETKKKLENLISNMTTIMKQQFESNFKIITQNFDTTFKELFGGGKAELKLSDESDILNSGIEIEVQPPGKKLQNMMLLSGGERALTATALLFAILQIKSPPFCILDEIEAALDDVNVHRFAEYIKEYSKKNQFIVITHRKGTMEVASSVYGITMQEYGISKVVSMKLK